MTKMKKIFMTEINSVMKVVRIHQHTKFHIIPSMSSQENAHKPQIWPISRSQNAAQIRRRNRPGPICNQFPMWSGYTSISNFRPLLPCVLKGGYRMVGNPHTTAYYILWRQHTVSLGHNELFSVFTQVEICSISRGILLWYNTPV